MKLLRGTDEDGAWHSYRFKDRDAEMIMKVMASAGEGDAVFIHGLARAVVWEECDPLRPTERGEPFEFAEPERKWRPLADDDFCRINPTVPPPDAEVDLGRALRECRDDLEEIALALGRRPSAEAHLRMMTIQLAWARFLVRRHPKAEGRARFAAALPQFEASMERMGMGRAWRC